MSGFAPDNPVMPGGFRQCLEATNGGSLRLLAGRCSSLTVGCGLHLITDYENDAQGRWTLELGPEHPLDLRGTSRQPLSALGRGNGVRVQKIDK